MPAWSAASSPSSAGAIRSMTLRDRLQDALAAVAGLVAVAQLDRLVGAGRGAGRARPPARPTPSARTTSTSTVGLPRESRISRASMKSMVGHAARASGRRSSRTAMPGSSRPSRNSSDAPPPVEMWVKRVGQALLLDRGHRVAAADDDRRAGIGALGQEARDGARAVRRTTGSRTRPAARSRTRSWRRRGPSSMRSCEALPEVDDVPRGRDLLGRDGLVLGAAGDLLGDDDVDRQEDLDARASRRPRGCAGRPRPGRARPGSCRRPCPGRAGRCWPCRRRGSSRSTFVSRLSRTLILSETLAPPMIAANGRAGVSRRSRERCDLALHQQPGVGRQELGDADGRGVRAVGGPERVVDVHVGVGRELRRERRVVRLLLGVEAQVLEQQRPRPLRRRLTASSVPMPERVAGHRHVAAEELRQALGDRAAGGGRRMTLPLGRPRWLARMTLAPRLEQVVMVGIAARMRESSRDLAVLERDVEVDADEDALAGDVGVADRELVHAAPVDGRRRRSPASPGQRRRAAGRRRTRPGRRRGSCSPTRCRTRR